MAASTKAKPPVLADEMEAALERLRREGGPVAIERDGKTVALLMTPEDLDDQIDVALFDQAMLTIDDEPRIPLKDVAVDWGVKLKSS